MVVDAVSSLDEDLNLDMIGIKKVAGGSMGDSFLVKGVAFKKTFSYAGKFKKNLILKDLNNNQRNL